MKKLSLVILILGLISCEFLRKDSSIPESRKTQDNPELIDIFEADQADRESDNQSLTEVLAVIKRDSLRKTRIQQLLDSNQVRTPTDFYIAAMVFQHGDDSSDYRKAMNLVTKAIELDSTVPKWLLAAATDRYLLSTGRPQIYGTQYFKDGDEAWKLENIDSTEITDEIRKEFGVETLAQQREKVKQMNLEEGKVNNN